MKATIRFAACQIQVGTSKSANVAAAVKAITDAAHHGADIVALPEMFCCPYSTKLFAEYAEPVPNGEACTALAEAAKGLGIWVIGGSIPENVDGGDFGPRIFNTCPVFGPSGDFVARHRKVHLFKVDAPGIKFDESESLSAGDELTSFDTPWGTIGIGICFDIRFPELARRLAIERGCGMLVFPGAFNMTTGPAHWELLARSRAVDNQCFLAAVAPARDVSSPHYVSWGHSIVVSPWGDVLAQAGTEQENIHAVIDHSVQLKCRQQLPVISNRRPELYAVWK